MFLEWEWEWDFVSVAMLAGFVCGNEIDVLICLYTYYRLRQLKLQILSN